MLRAFNITLSVLVAFTVWCAAIAFAVLVTFLVLKVVAVGGLTVYHLIHS